MTTSLPLSLSSSLSPCHPPSPLAGEGRGEGALLRDILPLSFPPFQTLSFPPLLIGNPVPLPLSFPTLVIGNPRPGRGEDRMREPECGMEMPARATPRSE